MKKKAYGRLQTITEEKRVKELLTQAFVLFFVVSIIVTGSEPTTPAQATLQGAIDWTQTYGGFFNEYAHAVIQTSDGGFVIAGRTVSFGAGYADFWLVKTNALGVPQWNKTYGGPSNDVVLAGIQTSDGGFALVGYTQSYGAGERDFWLVKTDTQGNLQWSRTYGGPKDEMAYSIVQTANGGFALAGSTKSYGTGGNDFWLVKTDANGGPQWTWTYGFSGNDSLNSMIQTTDGGFALTGYTDSVGAGKTDVWLMKTEADGRGVWSQFYGGPEVDTVWEVIQTADKGFMLAGGTESFGQGQSDGWLVKTNAKGISQWTLTYGGSATEYFTTLIQTTDGGFALTGISYASAANSGDFWLVKIKDSGAVEWTQTYGGAENEFPYSIIQTSDGGFAIGGSTHSFGAGSADIWLVKTISTISTSTATTTMPIITIIQPLPIIPILTSETMIPITTTPTMTQITIPTTTPETSPGPLIVTVTEEKRIIPGFTSFSVLLGLAVIILVFRKHRS